MGGLSFLQLCSSLLSLSFFLRISIAVDTLTPNQSISDGRNTLISAGGSFELGFFSPGNSKNRYLGIWYKKISTGTVVWVANREIPLTDSSGVLKFTDQGILILVNRSESIIWSSNSSRAAHNPVVQLLESGNLIVKDENNNNNPEEENSFWQSFDYPCDTFLAGMKLGFNLKTGLNRYMSSWKSNDDPSPGDYRYGLDPNGIPQLKLWKGSVVQYRAGTWNGVRFTGKPELKANPIYTFNFISNQNETYYTYRLINNSIVTRMVINSSGSVQRVTWVDQTKGWILLLMVPRDYCDTYALCGPYGSCNINNSPVCGCLKGFIPKSQDSWDRMDWSDGCIRKTPVNCEKAGAGFLRYQGVKLPDTLVSWVNRSMSLKECEVDCLNNCSCMAYANSDVTGGGSGCLLWFGDLIDNRVFSNGEGQDIYIRMAASELGQGGKLEFTSGGSDKKKKVLLIVTGVVLVTVMLFSGLICYLKKIRKVANRGGKMSQREDLELPLFDFIEITNATNNFSDDNKLGVGGFGPVYRAKLAEGQEIAVKRLSKHSGQGMQEFKNEVKLIAELQHRNLVKLLGCCIHKEEKMLIYEYMPNKSLNCFIFDQTRRTMLDWQKRYKIINGIARGLLYLHQDSRLRIIHRDLKASNILLDTEMNPKISDFGMARTFGGDQTATKTRRVVGTYGYMSPEYAIDGIFSIKSDVFSFGVLVLEIVSGMKNRGFCHPDHNLNLLGHAWRLWKEGKTSELIDALMEESYNLYEALRCIHVGLLCVQQDTQDRPSMSSVVLMLGSESAILPQPKQPGFFTERNPVREEPLSTTQESCSINEITVTLLEAR